MDALGAPTFVSVKLMPAGRVQTCVFDTLAAPTPAAGDTVVVRTNAGSTSLGTIVTANHEVVERRRALPDAAPQQILRRATRDDVVMRLRLQQREQEGYRIGLLKIRERSLPMKLARVELATDGSRMVFFFTAENRVDFRELVRELAAEFRMRIEMRQIGVRDEARMLGGYGSCGRPLCCATWMGTFEPVSIKMAKQQDLSLNPSKLSGLCGRLKCCLRFELPNAHGETRSGCGHAAGCSNASDPGDPGEPGGCGCAS